MQVATNELSIKKRIKVKTRANLYAKPVKRTLLPQHCKDARKQREGSYSELAVETASVRALGAQKDSAQVRKQKKLTADRHKKASSNGTRKALKPASRPDRNSDVYSRGSRLNGGLKRSNRNKSRLASVDETKTLTA